MFYCVTFLKSSSSSQVKHIHNIHHLLFKCQDTLQWCVHSPHLNAFIDLSPYSVEVQWYASRDSPSIQCQTQLVIIDHSVFHCVTCFKSVAQLCPTLCDPMNRNTPGLPVHHQLPEFMETHVHRVSDAIQPSHPLLSTSPLAPNPSQYQSLFQWVNSSHEVAKLLEFQL